MKKTRIAAAAACALMLIAPFAVPMVQNSTVHAKANIEDAWEWIFYDGKPCQSLNYYTVSTSRVICTRTAKYKDHNYNYKIRVNKSDISICHICDHYKQYGKTKDHYVKIRNNAGETKTGTAKCGSTAKASINGKFFTSDKKFKIYWGISSGSDGFEHDRSFK